MRGGGRVAQGGRFSPADLSEIDEYFSVPHIGRALFTCDANQDGQTDVVVTHATEPVALLVNHTDAAHRRIRFRLVGTPSERI